MSASKCWCWISDKTLLTLLLDHKSNKASPSQAFRDNSEIDYVAMDPLSISASVATVIAIFIQTVRLMKKTVETFKNAKLLLQELLSQTQRMRLLLEQLRSLTHQLGSQSTLSLIFNDSACIETINELKKLVTRIANKNSWINFRQQSHQNEANKLVAKLHRHEVEIVTLLQFVATYVSSILTSILATTEVNELDHLL